MKIKLKILLYLIGAMLTIADGYSQDLIVDQPYLKNTLSIKPITISDDCAVEEKCAAAMGDRKVLAFGTMIANIGSLDFIVGIPGGANWSNINCHAREWEDTAHWHYEGYANYQLYNNLGIALNIGHKNGFMVMDSRDYDANDNLSNARKYPLSNRTQGITAGWADVYPSGLTCQWLDITDNVPNGIYTLKITTNEERALREVNFENNMACATIAIEGNTLKHIGSILSITSSTIPSGSEVVEGALQTINCNTTYTISNGAKVNFQAGSEIKLLAGFSAQNGSNFTAVAKPIWTCSSGSSAREASESETSLNDNTFDFEVNPNPSEGTFYIKSLNFEKEPTNLIVTDLQGQVILAIPNFKFNEVSLAERKGMYIIKLFTANKVATKKVVIQ